MMLIISKILIFLRSSDCTYTYCIFWMMRITCQLLWQTKEKKSQAELPCVWSRILAGVAAPPLPCNLAQSQWQPISISTHWEWKMRLLGAASARSSQAWISAPAAWGSRRHLHWLGKGTAAASQESGASVAWRLSYAAAPQSEGSEGTCHLLPSLPKIEQEELPLSQFNVLWGREECQRGFLSFPCGLLALTPQMPRGLQTPGWKQMA